MKLKKRFVSALTLFVVGGVLFVVYFVDYGEKECKLYNSFRPVIISDSLDHIVQKIQVPDKAHRNCEGDVNIIFKDYQKLRICTRQNETSKTSIRDVIDIGDRVVKHAESDTVYIYKAYSGRGDYFFLLDGKREQ